MQRIRLLVLLLLCVVCQQTFAQQRTISGLVISAEDHEPLIGATISVQGNEAHGVVTDIDGKYTLEVGPGYENSVDKGSQERTPERGASA